MKYRKFILIGIYLFVFLVPLIPFKLKVSVIPVAVDFILITYMVFIIFLMLFNKKRRKILYDNLKSFIGNKLFLWIVVYTAACFLSLFPAVDKAIVITELIRFWTYIFMLFVIFTFVDSQKEISNIVKLTMLSVFIAGLIGLLQYALGDNTFPNPEMIGSAGRVYATFVNPNFWGAFINLLIFPALILAVRKVKHYKYIYIFIFTVFVNLILTYTRGSWLGFVIGLLLFIILFNKKLLIPILVIAPVSLFITGIRSRVFSIFDTNSWTIIERFKLWETGYLMFKEHPVLGVGNGNYLRRYSDYINKYSELSLGRDEYAVHNTYIKVMAETGIIGIIPFIMVIIYFIKEIYHVFKKPADSLAKDISLAFMCSIVSYLIQNISNEMFFVPQVHVFYWIIGALVIKYNRLKSQHID